MAVASFPEGFPVVLITSLASGAYRMAKKNAIVNRMSIIETLGETTVICTDKTGTITKGEMTVKKIFCDDALFEVGGAGYEAHGDFELSNKKVNVEKEEGLKLLIKAGIICNDSRITRTGEDNLYNISGLPTEAALLILGAKANTFKEDLKTERLEEIPFSSDRKMMSVVIQDGKEKVVYSKGALEILLKNCKYIWKNGGEFRLTEREKQKILKLNIDMASKAYRTLGIAYKKTYSIKRDGLEKDLVFTGFVAMEDPPRPEIKEALLVCKQAGISVKMITGDNQNTARSIAYQIGLDKGEVIEGKDIDNLSDEELQRTVKSIMIFARVRPEQKLRIVMALKANGEIVTMTGDGVNDAPALKEAHIGVAMGINGTDVSRSVADLTLKDDNFATIVDAIREGRTIFNNIQKFSTYQISVNFSQVALIFLAIVLGFPLPLVAIQILFMNLFSDEITAITLAFNPYSKDVMNLPPRKNSNIITKHLFVMVVVAGLIMCLGSLGVFKYMLSTGLGEDSARTVVFSTMVLFGITNAFNFRSFRKLTIGRSLLTNRALCYASIFVILSLVTLIYTPIGRIFELIEVEPFYLLIALGVSLLSIIVFDSFKYFNRTNHIWKDCC
jgi:P-type Ca2+ transporter type 2C